MPSAGADRIPTNRQEQSKADHVAPVGHRTVSILHNVLKRFSDTVLSALGLLLLSPVLLFVAAWIKRDSRGPVFYRGVRVGRNRRLFRIFKFRTMVTDADKIGGPSTSDDDPRITPAGHFIRRYKLDELPQLLNVLKGEMSLVGPRPDVPQEVELYTEEEKEILTVRPGITDYSSIKFHNEGEILRGAADPHQTYIEKIRPEKMRLRMEYVRTPSPGQDLRIILMTLSVLLFRQQPRAWGVVKGKGKI